jgi:Bacterial Ig-like domain (group 3)/FG-GAP-like repeat
LSRRFPAFLLFVAVFINVFPLDLLGVSFKTAPFLTTGTSEIEEAVTVDLNGDGHADLLYRDVGPLPKIQLGNGDGTFEAAYSPNVPAGSGTFGAFVVADVNHDGKLDLIASFGQGLTSNVGVMLGNGDGTFQPPILSPGESSNTSYVDFTAGAAVVDVNGDGAVDLIAADPSTRTITIYFGDNTGHFLLQSTTFDGGAPNAIYVGDLNGDGHPDFVSHGLYGADASVYINNGNGTFTPGAVYSTRYIGTLVLADMNHDGRLDMVTTDSDNGVEILAGNGNGTFSTTSIGGASYVGLVPGSVAVNDVNGDGILDIIVSSHNGIGILLGRQNLTFAPIQEYPVGYSLSQYVVTADFNGDGKLDIASGGMGGFAFLFGNGDGTFKAADAYDVGLQVTGAAIGDLNTDGLIDMAVGTYGFSPRILLGKSDGTFTVTPNVSLPTISLNTPSGITIADLNADHKQDLAFTQGNLYVALGNGDGTFAAPVEPLPSASFQTDAHGVWSADFNHDGLPDLIVGAYPFQAVLLAQPNGNFQIVSNPFQGGCSPYSVVLGDVNGDGNIDIVTASPGGSRVCVLLGKGDGTFTTSQTYLPTLQQYFAPGIALSDIDGDGKLDILLGANVQTSAAEIMYGHGDGTFDDPVAVTTPHAVTSIAAADLNVDGFQDLILSDGYRVTIMYGAGKRTFITGSDYLAGDGPSNPIVADLNGDGAPDLMFSNLDTNRVSTVTVLLNQGGTRGQLVVAPSPLAYGEPFTISATYAPTVAYSAPPSGSVGFSVDNGAAISEPIQNGSAIYGDNQLLAAGSHSASASWPGDSNFIPHNLSTAFTVSKANTATSLQITPTSVVIGQAVNLIVTVSPQFNGTPTGGVQIGQGGATVATGVLSPTSQFSYTLDTSKLSVGSQTYTASYQGDGNFSKSASPPSSLGITDYSISVNPSTTTPGANSQVQVTVTAIGGFTGTVNLSCSGLPANASCTFGKASLSLSGSPTATTTLNVSPSQGATIATSKNQSSTLLPSSCASGLIGSLVSCWTLWLARGRSLRLRCVVLLIAVAGVTLVTVSCGGNGSGSAGSSTGSGSVQVHAGLAGTTIDRSATLTLSVGQ